MDRQNPKCRGFLGWLLGHNFERPTWQPESWTRKERSSFHRPHKFVLILHLTSRHILPPVCPGDEYRVPAPRVPASHFNGLFSYHARFDLMPFPAKIRHTRVPDDAGKELPGMLHPLIDVSYEDIEYLLAMGYSGLELRIWDKRTGLVSGDDGSGQSVRLEPEIFLMVRAAKLGFPILNSGRRK